MRYFSYLINILFIKCFYFIQSNNVIRKHNHCNHQPFTWSLQFHFGNELKSLNISSRNKIKLYDTISNEIIRFQHITNEKRRYVVDESNGRMLYNRFKNLDPMVQKYINETINREINKQNKLHIKLNDNEFYGNPNIVFNLIESIIIFFNKNNVSIYSIQKTFWQSILNYMKSPESTKKNDILFNLMHIQNILKMNRLNVKLCKINQDPYECMIQTSKNNNYHQFRIKNKNKVIFKYPLSTTKLERQLLDSMDTIIEAGLLLVVSGLAISLFINYFINEALHPDRADRDFQTILIDSDNYVQIPIKCDYTNHKCTDSCPLSKFRKSLVYKRVEDSSWTNPLETFLTKQYDSNQCSICLQDYNSGQYQVLTPCGHIYHDTCLFSLYLNNNDFCPFCRQIYRTD